MRKINPTHLYHINHFVEKLMMDDKYKDNKTLLNTKENIELLLNTKENIKSLFNSSSGFDPIVMDNGKIAELDRNFFNLKMFLEEFTDETTMEIKELLEFIGKKINIASLIEAEQNMKKVFEIAKTLNFKHKETALFIRELLSISNQISSLLDKYLPIEYIMDAYEGDYVDEPDIVPAPYREMTDSITDLQHDVVELFVNAGPHGLNLGVEITELIYKVKQDVLLVY